MPQTNLSWRVTRPLEGFIDHEVLTPDRQPVRAFVPTGYEPNYPYPLVVFFHPRRGNEQQVLRLAPRLSDRNFVCIGLRGPELATGRADGFPGYSWGSDGRFDGLIEDYVFRAIEQTRRLYHVHSERLYLAGLGEGTVQAYRLALAYPERFAGVIALNGAMPRCGNPLFRWPEVRQLRAFLGHGIANSVVPLGMAREDCRLLYTAGIDVQLHTYPTTQRLHPDMLRDVNRWIISAINAE